MKPAARVLLLGACILLTGCAPKPAYIKEVVAYPEGDGLVVYFIMADKDGEMTKAKGHITVRIYQEVVTLSGTHDVKVYQRGRDITFSDFEWATVGMGPFTRRVLLMDWGYIKGSQLRVVDDGLKMVRVEVIYTSRRGEVLRGGTYAFLW